MLANVQHLILLTCTTLPVTVHLVLTGDASAAFKVTLGAGGGLRRRCPSATLSASIAICVDMKTFDIFVTTSSNFPLSSFLITSLSTRVLKGFCKLARIINRHFDYLVAITCCHMLTLSGLSGFVTVRHSILGSNHR